MMANFDDDRTDSTTLTKPKLKKPSMYAVVIINDDFSPMEFVVNVLKFVFAMSQEGATQVMLQIHNEGKAKVGSFTYDIAETKAAQIVAMARQRQHPLLAVAEPT